MQPEATTTTTAMTHAHCSICQADIRITDDEQERIMEATVTQADNWTWWVVNEETGERIVGPFMTESAAVGSAIRHNGTDHNVGLENYLGRIG